MIEEIDMIEWQPVPEIEGRGALEIRERLKNIRANCASPVKRVDKALPPNGQAAIIVCYGPSLNQTWLRAVDEAKQTASPIVTVSMAHDFLLERGVTPNVHVEFDPREHKANCIKEPTESTLYLIASRCHPSLRIRLRGRNVLLWHAEGGAKENEEIKRCDKKAEGIMIPGGACVGLRAITVMHTLGFRSFSVYGFDCSYADGQEWAGAHPGQTKKDRVLVRSNGRVFTTAPVYTIYARQFLETWGRLNDSDFRLHGEGLLQTMAALYMKRLNQQEIAA